MDINESVSIIEQEISQLFSGKQPKELYQPMQYMLGLNAHRTFPQLTLWGSYLFAGAVQPALVPATGVEVFYGFFLIHDDLLEHKSSRNNQQSIHTRWNNNIAILSGDAMIFKALELLIQVETPLIKPTVKLFNKCFTEICEQKQRELSDTFGKSELPEPCHRILAGFSMCLGAMIGGANHQELQVVDKLARSLGTGLKNTTPELYQAIESLNCDQQRKDHFLAWISRSSVGCK